MKRFWKAASIERTEEGWGVLLDKHPVMTPARRRVVVPAQAMADMIAEEWSKQDDVVRPQEMPMTRTAATCLDRVAPHIEGICETIAEYGGSDLLCYRAEHPAALILWQEQSWDPVLKWAADVLGAQLSTGQGIIHVAQPPKALTRLSDQVGSMDAWELTAVADLTQISGSLVLALAVFHRHLTGEDALTLSRIDEDWNIQEWGEDADAAALAVRRKSDFLHAVAVLEMLQDRSAA